MDNRYVKLKNLDGFSAKEKEIYKYILDKFQEYTSSGDIYHYEQKLNFDFVEPTDATIIQKASEKYNLSEEEIDRIIIKIESNIFD